LIPSPIHKVLSTLRGCRVRFLLMGGQACVLFGAAEFSRDTDIFLVAEGSNFRRLRKALAMLEAEPIAVPRLSASILRRGHAVHFRCRHPDAANIRLDVMTVLRGLPTFSTLWRRRVTITGSEGWTVDVMSLPDLVLAKKTQRDKDWPMVRRLVEGDVIRHEGPVTARRLSFWLRELRTPELLSRVAQRNPAAARRLVGKRSLLRLALSGHLDELQTALRAEEDAERARDRSYWGPLRQELERLRRTEIRHRRASRRDGDTVAGRMRPD
jgi:hypothetical protein